MIIVFIVYIRCKLTTLVQGETFSNHLFESSSPSPSTSPPSLLFSSLLLLTLLLVLRVIPVCDFPSLKMSIFSLIEVPSIRGGTVSEKGKEREKQVTRKMFVGCRLLLMT
ncbi:hypothetical protein Phum_PHUM511900 [Pediculus humanus corporis]|uniref:Uncharacterized protein n=1 Tax=Pediculus humanus subsp. corporis TaxID=121224 RepID=E0VY91_PEDHC|nr:uncharacterized protein Phum_PHUM511900 [Pediculus humanus corporis]EEB18347.1 hypothetical protein Phum_PHUM511900 [Pediculus humanus corporis]